MSFFGPCSRLDDSPQDAKLAASVMCQEPCLAGVPSVLILEKSRQDWSSEILGSLTEATAVVRQRNVF